MAALDADGTIYWSSQGIPSLKYFYTDAVAAALRDLGIDESVADAGAAGPSGRTVELIVRQAMREVARRIAFSPAELFTVEWRDLERLLREVFEALGFATYLTAPAKDGGFDLRLRCTHAGLTLNYLVEVKHWRTSRPGTKIHNEFLDIVVREPATRGLLLSTSGFGKELLRGRLEVERQRVRLGAAAKIVGLCQLYFRKSAGLIDQELILPTVLFEATQ